MFHSHMSDSEGISPSDDAENVGPTNASSSQSRTNKGSGLKQEKQEIQSGHDRRAFISGCLRDIGMEMNTNIDKDFSEPAMKILEMLLEEVRS